MHADVPIFVMQSYTGMHGIMSWKIDIQSIAFRFAG